MSKLASMTKRIPCFMSFRNSINMSSMLFTWTSTKALLRIFDVALPFVLLNKHWFLLFQMYTWPSCKCVLSVFPIEVCLLSRTRLSFPADHKAILGRAWGGRWRIYSGRRDILWLWPVMKPGVTVPPPGLGSTLPSSGTFLSMAVSCL